MEDPVEKTIGIYGGIANAWKDRYGNMPLMREMADFFISKLSGKRVLDAGCGPGRDVQYFCENRLEVTGIDLCPEFLKLAKASAPNAKLKKMDIRNLDFPLNHFDGVWAAASLLHVPKIEAGQTLAGFKRVLNKGGILYISLVKGEGEGFMELPFGSGRFFAHYSEEEIRGLLNSHGFEIIKLSTIQGQVRNSAEWLNIFACKK